MSKASSFILPLALQTLVGTSFGQSNGDTLIHADCQAYLFWGNTILHGTMKRVVMTSEGVK